MSTEANKDLMRRLIQVPNTGDYSPVDEVIGEDFVYRSSAGEEYHGRDGFKELVSTYRQAFPDLEMTPEEIVAEGDTVFIVFTQRGTHQGPLMDIQPTGKKVTLPMISRARFEDGKLVDLYELFDSLDLMGQLGVIEQDIGAEAGRVAPGGQQRPRPTV